MNNLANLFTAVVGTGFIGPVHVEALRRLGRPVLTVLGSTPDKTRAAVLGLGAIKSFESYEEMLADPMIGVVHVASPNHLHFEQCRPASHSVTRVTLPSR